MQRGYRGVAGTPVRPYINYTVNSGSDCWLTLQFLDRFNNPAIPTIVSYRVDCLTTDYVVLTDTFVPGPITTSTVVINFPAIINIIGGGPNANDVGQNSQNNQVTVTGVFSDGSQAKEVFLYEVIAIQTVGGAGY